MKLLPLRHNDEESWFRLLTQTINGIINGNINTNSSVTLTENQTTTTVTDRRIGKDSVVYFDSRTANAAAELASGNMYISSVDPLNNQFVITHTNNSQTDRTFKYAFIGQTLN